MSRDPSKINFSIKAVVVSIILAMLLAASNTYLALKIGTTIAASIPAAVLSIGIFRFFKHYSVFECNLVQTAASAGEGIAAAVSFVLPALIIVHIWTHFNYWMTLLIVCCGGLLGVFFSIPLRRVLLDLPHLKYPEGTAIGNVLKVSTQKGRLLQYLLKGIGAGALINFLQQGMQLVSSAWPLWLKTRGGVLMGMTLGFDPAAYAAGFIIGPSIAMSMIVGLILGWIILIPIFSIWLGAPVADNAYDAVMTLWSHDLRYVGVGTLLVGGVWTLIKLIGPIINGIKMSFSLLGKKHLVAEHDRDVPMIGVGLGVLIFSALLFWLLTYILSQMGVALSVTDIAKIAVITLVFLMIIGFILATICGYITGIVGSTNNPISGMIIISLLLLGLVYLALFDLSLAGVATQVVGVTLLMAAIIGAIVTISNENMQDLKAGQMIGAAPWKQQVMLAVGVVASSLVVAPILELLYNAYGIGGAFPRAGMDPAQMLAAPQANLMATLAQGIFNHNLNWKPILIGMAIAIIVIFVDELILAKRNGFRLIVIAVGFSIYLPPDLITSLIFGSLTNAWVGRTWTQRKLPKEQVKQVLETSNLLACGLVAGASLMGVFLAVPFVLTGNVNILAPHFVNNPHLSWLINILGVISILVLMKMLLLKRKDIVA
jgi:putative OPT family oligopeptide transporter